MKKRNSLYDIGISNNTSLVPEFSFLILDKLQSSWKGNVVLSVAVVFVLICERFNLDKGDLIRYAQNLLNQNIDSATYTQYKAIKDFLENEM